LKYRPPGRRLRHRVHPPSLQAGRSAGFPLLAGAPRRHRVAEASPSRSLAAARVHRDAPLHPRQVRSPAIHRLSVAGALPSCCAPCVARRSAARGSSTHATLAMGVASAPTARAARTAAGAPTPRVRGSGGRGHTTRAALAGQSWPCGLVAAATCKHSTRWLSGAPADRGRHNCGAPPLAAVSSGCRARRALLPRSTRACGSGPPPADDLARTSSIRRLERGPGWTVFEIPSAPGRYSERRPPGLAGRCSRAASAALRVARRRDADTTSRRRGGGFCLPPSTRSIAAARTGER